ncbi:MAG TPA: peptidase M50 [Micromonosporaceae bacterium]|nr:peptidase M50 [Micromonosporaceae bacterium]
MSGGSDEYRPSGFQVGRVFGFPLRLTGSWVFLALFIVIFYSQTLGESLGLAGAARYLAGVGFVAGLLLSVLLHELGHALTARRYGVGVRGITLDLLGGYTEFDQDSPRPGIELATALAGPGVSALLGLGCAALAFALPNGTIGDKIAIQLAVANLIVAIYNALPGWPLDGGRALRAAVWAIKGDRDSGLLVAGWSGRVVAVLTGAAALFLYLQRFYTVFSLVIGAWIAFTIWRGATMAVLTARVRARYPMVDPVQLARPIFNVPAGTSLAEAIRRAEEAGQPQSAIGVTDPDGRLIALVVPAAAAAVPDQRRPWVAVETVARAIDSVATIPANARGADVIKLLRGDPDRPYLVMAGDDVVGVVTIMDVVRVLDPEQNRR